MEMTAWDKVISFFSARQAFARSRYRTAAKLLNEYSRKYEGAAGGRRTKNWKASSTSAASEIETSLVTLRNRSRQLVRDNPYAAKGMQAITSNVIGWGIFTQVKVDAGQSNSSGKNKLAEQRTRELSRVWKAWAETTAIDYDGRNNLSGIQRLVMRGVAESGEILIRKRRSSRKKVLGSDGVEVEVPPIQLQVLEGDFLDLNGVSSTAAQGNTIIHGIEFDANGNRVAYHLFEEHPGNSFSRLGMLKSKFNTVRVLAEDVLHVYRLDRPGQIRGVPWLAPVMIRLKDFDEYEDAQLVRQKVAAMFAVFVKDLDGIDAINPPAEGELGEKVEPGIIEILPPGKDVSFANPPGVEGYGAYSSNVLHAVSAGLGITYEALTGDLSQVNFSSARMGFLEMNRNIEEWRNDIMIAQFLDPTFNWFKEGAQLIGNDTTRARAVHTPPRREMVDPSKEIGAMKEAVRSGFMTLSEAIRNNGYDPDQHFNELQTDNALIDKLGLVLDTDPRQDAQRIKPAEPSAAPST